MHRHERHGQRFFSQEQCAEKSIVMPTINCNSIKEIYWQNTKNAPLELAGEILIWRFPASATFELKKYWHALLDVEEAEKASRFRQDKDRQRFITSRIALKLLLAKFVAIDPSKVRISPGENKKPYVIHDKQIKLEFNLTHAGDWILIAIASVAIGIDMEKIDGMFAFHDIMEFSFLPEEIQFVQNADIPRQQFYTMWTRKEAMLKATAKGLDDDLRTVPALDGTHAVSDSISGPESKWNITSFEVDKNHPGSVAYPMSIDRLQFFHADAF
ncbi:MAG: hypothetical protein C5B59_04275 [Bacteroidetes bacterium]|nr:MAG: hypothetical protein C5B59_04275 [Bacteroidota bacterium]